jgi:L-cysteine desulfidase
MQSEKKTCRFIPLSCLKDMTTMYERSRVSVLSACILGQEGTADNMVWKTGG